MTVAVSFDRRCEAAKEMSAWQASSFSTDTCAAVRLKVIEQGTALEAAAAFPGLVGVDLDVSSRESATCRRRKSVVVVSQYGVLIIAQPGSSIDSIVS